MNKSDKWIRESGVITPCLPKGGDPSYGLSSHGYDLRLDPYDLRVSRRRPDITVDPLNFRADECLRRLKSPHTHPVELHPGDCLLGFSVEYIDVPKNIIGTCTGKSTYARTGILVNTTPLEAGWRGHLTIEISNLWPSPVLIYPGQGICQVVFAEGEPCEKPYVGKYQDQGPEVVTARGK